MITLMALAIMSAAEPLPPVEDFLKQFAERRKGVTALHADFTQDNNTGGEVDSVAGTIFYANPRRIIFRYPKAELTYVFDDLRVYEYDAAAQQVQTHELQDDPQTEALFLGFGEDVSRLPLAYDISLFTPDSTECGSMGVSLRPKKAREEGGAFQEVRLYLQGENYLPCRVRIINDEDSTVTIDVRNLRVNPPYEPEETQVKLAPGTKILREDMLQGEVPAEGMLVPEEPIVTMSDLEAPAKASP